MEEIWHICNLYVEQRVTLHLNKEEMDSIEIGRGFSHHLTYGEYLTKESLADVEDFSIGVGTINKVRFTNDTPIK